MGTEGQKPEDLGYGREQMQRIRAELCGFVDRTPNLLLQDPGTHKFFIDTNTIQERGFGSHFTALYKEDTAALVDDVLFYRFVKATHAYIDAPDDIARRRIAYEEFIPYMEYLLNTPRTLEEKIMMEAVGYQPLNDETKERIAEEDPDFKFHLHDYPPKFSPEYKEYFLQIRLPYLHTFEYVPDPESKTPSTDWFIQAILGGPEGGLSGVPQDVIREGLSIPEEVEHIPETDLEGESDLIRGIVHRTREVLGRLEPIERRLMMLLFGFQDAIPRTIAEVAKILGMTMEEVKEKEKQVLDKLRKKKQD